MKNFSAVMLIPTTSMRVVVSCGTEISISSPGTNRLWLRRQRVGHALPGEEGLRIDRSKYACGPADQCFSWRVDVDRCLQHCRPPLQQPTSIAFGGSSGLFFPSLVLWSSQALKDGIIVLVLALAIFCTLRLLERLPSVCPRDD